MKYLYILQSRELRPGTKRPVWQDFDGVGSWKLVKQGIILFKRMYPRRKVRVLKLTETIVTTQ